MALCSARQSRAARSINVARTDGRSKRGAADRLEDLLGCCLTLERTRQLAVPRLELLEQPHVLDGDHGLGGERLRQLDLLGREGFDLAPPHVNDANGAAFTQERRGQHCPSWETFQRVGKFRFGQRLEVLDVDSVRSRTARPATELRFAL